MILRNCRLIPELCEGFQEEMADIRIEKKKIAEILPAGGSYTGEMVLEINGMTVLPGLFNCHVHIGMKRNNFDAWHNYTMFDHVFQSINYSQHLLSYGFTTLKDCGSLNDTAIKVRDAINAGIIEGPNIEACGSIYTPSFKDQSLIDYYSSCNKQNMPVNKFEDIVPAVRQAVARGADFIKLTTTSSKRVIKKAEDQVGKFLFYPEEIAEFARAAEKEDVYLTCHSTCEESHEAVIAAGARTLDHGIYLRQKHVDQILANGNKTALVPTLAVSYVGYKQNWPTYDVCHPGAGNGMKMAHDAGVLVGFGTDDFQNDFRKMPAVEFIARCEFGLTPIDVIKQATINSAKILGVDDKKGTIKVGKVADLAVFEGKPDEDVTVFNNAA